MTRETAFTAEILRTSTRGLAGMAAARLLESDDRFQERYGEEAFASWQKAMEARLGALVSAMDAQDVALFVEDIGWFEILASKRGIPRDDLEAALAALRATVAETLTEAGDGTVAPYFDAAVRALDGGVTDAPEFETGSDASHFFSLALLGDLGATRTFLTDGVRGGRFDVTGAIVDVVLPAAREAGRRWHLGRFGVAAEHVVTSTLRAALFGLSASMPSAPPNGRAAFLAAVPGDAHDTALVAFAVLLEHLGWRVALAGADTPTEEIDATAMSYECHLVVLAATLPTQRRALYEYFTGRTSSIPVLLGGRAVRSEDDARELGANGFAQDLVSGAAAAHALVGLPPA